MEIEKLQRATRFLGKETNITTSNLYVRVDKSFLWETFNPHEKTGRHWLVEIMRKLTPGQFAKFHQAMQEYYFKNGSKLGLQQWYFTVPSELCFEKLLEVIG